MTVLGLGAMGSALAKAFLDSDVPTTVWNRTTGHADGLVAAGAKLADTPAAASELAIICVVDNDAARQVLGDMDVAGRTIVNLTNGTPAQARDIAAAVTARGGRYLDGGIMAVPSMIGGPAAFVLYSGAQHAYDEHRPTFELLGRSIYLGHDPGLAPLYDIALLSGMYGLFGGILQSLALVKSADRSATEFAELLGPWLGAMASGLPRFAEDADTGRYDEDVESSLGMQAAAYGNFIATSEGQGIRPDLLVPMQQLLDRGVEDGRGAHNISSLIQLLEKR